ncbi:MAG: right-handed parallel beta-helix repeat-containing protein, partial [Coprobacillaceae bacterium]
MKHKIIKRDYFSRSKVMKGYVILLALVLIFMVSFNEIQTIASENNEGDTQLVMEDENNISTDLIEEEDSVSSILLEEENEVFDDVEEDILLSETVEEEKVNILSETISTYDVYTADVTVTVSTFEELKAAIANTGGLITTAILIEGNLTGSGSTSPLSFVGTKTIILAPADGVESVTLSDCYFKLEGNVELQLHNIHATGNASNSVIGVQIMNDSHLILNNSTLSNYKGGSSGGAIYMKTSNNYVPKLTLTNNSSIYNNSAASGAAVLAEAKAVITITDSIISNNVASSYGGAIHAIKGSTTINITNSNFHSNSGRAGAGIYVLNTGTNISVTGGSFYINVSTTGGGAIYGQSIDTVTIKNCNIYENQATSSSGGGAGLYLRIIDTVVIQESTINNNTTADSGGGVLAYAVASLTIEGGTINGNTAYNGGGVYCGANSTQGTMTLKGVEISENKAAGGVGANGAGMYLFGYDNYYVYEL